MSGLKQLRSRIKSIKTTQKITKAMQVVAATKFTKAKSLIKNSEDYIEILYKIIGNIATENNLQDMSAKDKKFFLENSNKPCLLIVITSERGLCGSFNFLITKLVKSDIENLKNLGKEIKLIIIGKKGHDILKGEHFSYIDSYFEFPKPDNDLYSHDPTNWNVKQGGSARSRDILDEHANTPQFCETNLQDQKSIALKIKEKLMDMIENTEIGNCQLYFNKCKNAMLQIPTKQQIFPIIKPDPSPGEKYLSYEYEGEDLVVNMVNLYIFSQINYAILHSRASEEGARMTAMDNATKNANGLIDKLTLKLNKSRQESITKDLIEIIAGVEAS